MLQSILLMTVVLFRIVNNVLSKRVKMPYTFLVKSVIKIGSGILHFPCLDKANFPMTNRQMFLPAENTKIVFIEVKYYETKTRRNRLTLPL